VGVRTSPHYTAEHSVGFHTSGDRQTSSERRATMRGECRVVVAHDEDGRTTPGGVIVVGSADVVHVLDILGN